MQIPNGYDPELKAFKEQAGAGATPASLLRKGFIAEVKADGAPDDRTIKFAISTGDVDRDADTLAVAGWNLKDYLANPVVLWAHDGSQPPVAKAVSVAIEGGKLKSVAQFMDADMSVFADSIFRMYKGGFLNAVSVGFLPRKWQPAQRDGGFMPMDFLEQDLMEYSCVPVPANPNALQEAKHKAGINITPLATWAESIMDSEHGSGLWVPRATLEKVYSESRAHGRVISIPGFTPNEQANQADVSAESSEQTAASGAGETKQAEQDKPMTTMKSGRVLSSKHEKLLRSAHDNIKSILDAHDACMKDEDDKDEDVDNDDDNDRQHPATGVTPEQDQNYTGGNNGIVGGGSGDGKQSDDEIMIRLVMD